MEKIEIPAAPAGLPASVEKKWKQTYETAFKEAQEESPDDVTTQRQLALREANRLLKTPELTSYSQTMDIDDFHFVLREPSKDGKTLRVVTRHGKKYTFPIPAKAQKPVDDKTADDKKKGNEGANGNGGAGTGA
ncbi:MAG TPA: hypothetical protein VGP89_12915 [Candidatus Angelobacter sp.]|jgi:hypothetical protein|nr:hypothetical protein [Candidatus Angelobacter sp.]